MYPFVLTFHTRPASVYFPSKLKIIDSLFNSFSRNYQLTVFVCSFSILCVFPGLVHYLHVSSIHNLHTHTDWQKLTISLVKFVETWIGELFDGKYTNNFHLFLYKVDDVFVHMH